jgi:hypothetical protein
VAARSDALPSPLWGGVGGGGPGVGREPRDTLDPPSVPSPQGGREQTADAARAVPHLDASMRPRQRDHGIERLRGDALRGADLAPPLRRDVCLDDVCLDGEADERARWVLGDMYAEIAYIICGRVIRGLCRIQPDGARQSAQSHLVRTRERKCGPRRVPVVARVGISEEGT